MTHTGFMEIGIVHYVKLLLGTPRRLLLHLFKRDAVQTAHARRTGECKRCGACCRIGWRCMHLRFNEGLAECAIYKYIRTPNCRNFPIDSRDIADRDRVSPGTTCGFSFPAEDVVAGDVPLVHAAVELTPETPSGAGS